MGQTREEHKQKQIWMRLTKKTGGRIKEGLAVKFQEWGQGEK